MTGMDKEALREELRGVLREEFREVFREEFRKELAVLMRDAACPLPEWAAPEIGHCAGMVKDIGMGDMGRGVEEIRENHKLVCKMRLGIGTAGKAIITVLAAGALSALVWGLVVLGKLNLDKLGK